MRRVERGSPRNLFCMLWHLQGPLSFEATLPQVVSGTLLHFPTQFLSFEVFWGCSSCQQTSKVTLAWNPPPDLGYAVFCISPILFVESLVPVVLPLNYSQYSLINYDMNFRVLRKLNEVKV